MKTQLGFLALGLGLGTAAGWMMGASSSSESPAVATVPKTERPVAASSSSKDAEPGEKRATKRERPEKADPKPGEPKVMSFSSGPDGEMPPEMKEIFAKMEEERKAVRARKIDERLAALKSRLNLTPDQEAKVRALLESSPEMDVGGFFKSMKTSPDGKSGGLAIGGATSVGGEPANAGKLDDQIAALLSSEQQDEFSAFQQEQRENRVEIATNREMVQLQQQLTLTPEQKDQAFQALGDIARKEAENPQKRLDPAAMEAAKQARTDALRPILTPEQMKAYESNPTTPMSFRW